MKTCTVDLCGKKHMARGFCKNHYEQFKRSGELVRRSLEIVFCVECGASLGAGSKKIKCIDCKKKHKADKRLNRIKLMSEDDKKNKLNEERIKRRERFESMTNEDKKVFLSKKLARWRKDRDKNKEKEKEKDLKKKARHVKDLPDCYVASKLGMQVKDCSEFLLSMKREQILLCRDIRLLNKTIKEIENEH